MYIYMHVYIWNHIVKPITNMHIYIACVYVCIVCVCKKWKQENAQQNKENLQPVWIIHIQFE